TKRMLDGVTLSGSLGSRRLAGDSASDRFLRCAIVVVLDLRVVGSFPVDEDADEDVKIVSFSSRNDAFSNRVLNGLGNAVRGGADHLDGLTGFLDGDLVEQNRVGLAEQVRRDNGEEGGEAGLVVGQRVAECRLGGAAARSDDEI